LPEVGQRAMAWTIQMVAVSHPVNLIASTLAGLPKPAGAAADSEAVAEAAPRIPVYRFSSVYIEDNAGTVSVVIVSADKADPEVNDYPAAGFYDVKDGLNRLSDDTGAMQTGERPVVWTAQTLKADCSAQRQLPLQLSSACLIGFKEDNVSFQGHDNVIIVSPLHTLETRFYYQLHDKVESSVTLTRLAFMDQTQGIPALRASSMPVMSPPISGPLHDYALQIIADNGLVYGANDILSWPAFSTGLK
jgi:hypothetical protein